MLSGKVRRCRSDCKNSKDRSKWLKLFVPFISGFVCYSWHCLGNQNEARHASGHQGFHRRFACWAQAAQRQQIPGKQKFGIVFSVPETTGQPDFQSFNSVCLTGVDLNFGLFFPKRKLEACVASVSQWAKPLKPPLVVEFLPPPLPQSLTPQTHFTSWGLPACAQHVSTRTCGCECGAAWGTLAFLLGGPWGTCRIAFPAEKGAAARVRMICSLWRISRTHCCVSPTPA